MPRSLLTLALVGGLAIAGLPLTARAQAPSPEVRAEAKRLYEAGVALFKQAKYAEAAGKFQAAFNLDPSPVLLYNLARATEKAGEPEAAIAHYRAYLVRFPQTEDRPQVERIIEALESAARAQRKGFLSIEDLPASGVSVFLDSAVAPAPGKDGRWRLAPGRHQVQVRTDDGHQWSTEVDLVVDQATSARYVGRPDASAPPEDAAELSSMALGGWIAVGVGAAALGAGGYFFARATASGSDAEDARDTLAQLNPNDPRVDGLASDYGASRDDLSTFGVTSYVLFGVGAAAAATGAVLLVIGGQDGTEAALTPTLRGLGLVGRF
mgnify:CR=1 FL=1